MRRIALGSPAIRGMPAPAPPGALGPADPGAPGLSVCKTTSEEPDGRNAAQNPQIAGKNPARRRACSRCRCWAQSPSSMTAARQTGMPNCRQHGIKVAQHNGNMLIRYTSILASPRTGNMPCRQQTNTAIWNSVLYICLTAGNMGLWQSEVPPCRMADFSANLCHGNTVRVIADLPCFQIASRRASQY
jgi:hypothetical protein